MLQSIRALMTPTVLRGRRRRRSPHCDDDDDDDKTTTTTMKPMAGTPDTAMESPSREEDEGDVLLRSPTLPQLPPISIPDLYQLLDTQLRVNMGAAVRCGICLSTLTPPIARTPCGHVYCRDCIVACCMSHSSSSKCPECQTPISKRSLQASNNDFLVLLARQYKTTLQDFGWTPSTYQADFTTLTQKPMGGDSSGSHMDDDDEEDEEPSLVDRWHVAATWQQQAFQVPESNSSPSKGKGLLHRKMTPLQQQENQAVVEANQRACERLGYTIVQSKGISAAAQTKSSPPPPSPQFPNTQDVLDMAREQQVADYELVANKYDEEDEDEKDDEEKCGQDKPPHDKVDAPSQPWQEKPSLAPVHQETNAFIPVSAPCEQESSTHMTESQQERRRVSFFMDPPPLPQEQEQPEKGDSVPEASRTINHNDNPSEEDSSMFFTPQEQSSSSLSSLRNLDLSPIPRKSSAAAAFSPSSPSLCLGGETRIAPVPSTHGTGTTREEEEEEDPSAPPRRSFQATRLPKDSTSATTTTTIVNSNNKSSNISITTGIVEDSFGAIHWINHNKNRDNSSRNSNSNSNNHNKHTGETLSLSQSVDEDTDLSLSLTATYDDPSMDYKQKRVALEAEETAGDTHGITAVTTHNSQVSSSHNNSNPSNPSRRMDVEEDSQDDSQETQIRCGGGTSRLERNVELLQNDDSDATCHMSSAEVIGEGDESSVDDEDRKPPATKESSQHSLAAQGQLGQEETTLCDDGDDEDLGMPDGIRRPNRPRAQSVPDRGSAAHGHSSSLSVGDIVNVQSRTWSGINKPGGVARITKRNDDGSYNVAYVLGGRESNVDAAFVSKSDDSGKGKRRETIDHAALPAALLRALKAQGFDTTGTLTLEQAKEAAAVDIPRGKKAKVESDLSNQTVGAPTDSRSTKSAESSMTAKGKTVPLVGNRKRKSREGIELESGKKHQKVVHKTISPKSSSGPKRKATLNATVTSSSSKYNKTSMVTSESGDVQHELSNEEACVLADARYKSQFEDALKKKVLHVVTSGLSSRDNDNLNSLSSRMLSGNGTYEHAVKALVSTIQRKHSNMSRSRK